jgi:hypothetical protein
MDEAGAIAERRPPKPWLSVPCVEGERVSRAAPRTSPAPLLAFLGRSSGRMASGSGWLVALPRWRSQWLSRRPLVT